MRVVLDAFKASMPVADTTREVAHSISPRAASRIVPPSSGSSCAPVPGSRDSHLGAPKTSSRSRSHSFSMSPAAPKSKPASASTSQELVVIEESAEGAL